LIADLQKNPFEPHEVIMGVVVLVFLVVMAVSMIVDAHRPSPKSPGGTETERVVGKPAQSQAPSPAPLTLFGCVRPLDPNPVQIEVAAGYRPGEGLVKTPVDSGMSRPTIPEEWLETNWQVFTLQQAVPVSVSTERKLEAAYGRYSATCRLKTPAPAGVAIARAPTNPRPRVPRQLDAESQQDLAVETKRFLVTHGLPDTVEPNINASYQVDLDGDGTLEQVWSARSRPRSSWNGNAETGPEDYALLALRHVGEMGHVVPLMFLPASQIGKLTYEYCAPEYIPLSPIDVNSDGKMEICLWADYNESGGYMLIFRFDGKQAVCIYPEGRKGLPTAF
jgi:hypothetical protein